MKEQETKPELPAGLIKSPCPSVFLSYPNAKAVFFSRNKEINNKVSCTLLIFIFPYVYAMYNIKYLFKLYLFFTSYINVNS